MAKKSLNSAFVILFLILLFWLPIALDFTINIPNTIAYVLFSIPPFIIFFFGLLNKNHLLEVVVGSLIGIILIDIAMIIDANLHVEGGWLHDSISLWEPLVYLLLTFLVVPSVFSLVFIIGRFTGKKFLIGKIS